MPAYLDHAATTPMRASAIAALTDAVSHTGNPSSLHTAGRAARRRVEESREQLAAALGAHPSEVIFTSGGTESDNLAVKGALWASAALDPARRRLVVSGIEHHAILDPAEHLVGTGQATLTVVEPDDQGLITAGALTPAVDTDVALVSVMWANNEIGTIAPIPELAEIAHRSGAAMHTDAVQAVGQVPVNFADSGVDLLSVSGHKIGGPVGVGALLVRRAARLTALIHGGGQERTLRSGTVPTAFVHAFAVAAAEAVEQRANEAQRLMTLRDRLIHGVLELAVGATVTGPWAEGNVTDRLPNNVHLLIPGVDGEALLFLLDAAGIACSSGSACTAGVARVSHVVRALGIPSDEARGALRLTLGHTSSDADVEALLRALPEAVTRARAARGVA